MELKEYILNFTKQRSLDPIAEENRIYSIPMNGFNINCFLLGRHICFESKVITLPESELDQESIIKILADGMTEIIDYDACLGINDNNEFMLFERFLPEQITASDFIMHVKKFGAVYLHLNKKIEHWN